VWRLLAELARDDEANRSNRFEMAEELNRRLGTPRFWGKPHHHSERYPLIPPRRPSARAADDRRLVEELVPSAKPVFQLAYTGAVGSQSLLGIAGLEGLRRRTGAAVWPFETGFAGDLSARAVLCEIYPSLLVRRHEGEGTKDEAQVRAAASAMAAFDEEGLVGDLLGPPPGMGEEALQVMLREEGSIMGAGVLGKGKGDSSCAS
jgi:precorrin-8X/cobalt-precorrin-8 methylmutase